MHTSSALDQTRLLTLESLVEEEAGVEWSPRTGVVVSAAGCAQDGKSRMLLLLMKM